LLIKNQSPKTTAGVKMAMKKAATGPGPHVRFQVAGFIFNLFPAV
jgi:hypothetical protein